MTTQLPTSKDPDVALRNMDDEKLYKYMLIDSDNAEELFARQYLDLELDPYQVFSMKVLRGRFRTEEEAYKFIHDSKMEWLFENGWIQHNGKPGFSPYYFDKPGELGKPNALILWPAGFGKTTVVSTRCIPVMSICDNPNARLQFIGKNETESFSFSTSIRRELMNPRLVKDFGDFMPVDKAVPWSNNAFSVQQRQWRDVRENFEFYGTNSHAELGKRSDQVYIDDVETPDTARTPDMRAKFLEWVRIGPLTSARPLWERDKNDQVKVPQRLQWSKTARYYGTGVVGTIFHPEAFYAMLMRDPTFTCIKFDCWKDKKCSISLSDKMLKPAALDAARDSLKTIAFNKRFRNISFNEEEMAFREAWIRGHDEEVNGVTVSHPGCLDLDRSFEETDSRWEILLGFDPASGSKSRWSAFAAYVVLGYDKKDPEHHIYLIDYLKLQDNFDRMLDHLLEGNPMYAIPGFYAKYRYATATVEKNAFGKWIIDNDRMKPYVDKNLIRPSYTGNNKTDPESGVFAMGAMLQNGRFRIPYATPADESKAETFIGEMLMYPKGTCDLIMALWLAQIPIRDSSKDFKSWFTTGGSGTMIHNPAYD